MQVRTWTCHMTRSPLARRRDHFGWPHTPYFCAYYLHAPKLWEGKETRNMYIVNTAKGTSEKESDLSIFTMNQLHLCWNCSQKNERSSFSYRFAYIVGLFSILLVTKYCTNLNALNPASDSLHRKFTSTSLDFTSNSISDSLLN